MNKPEQAANCYMQKLSEAGRQVDIAEKLGVSQCQISRWIKKGAVIINGEIYRPVSTK